MASGTADLQRDLGGAIMQSIFGALLTAGYAAAATAAISSANAHVTSNVENQLTKSFDGAEAIAKQYPRLLERDHRRREGRVPPRRPVGLHRGADRGHARRGARLLLLPRKEREQEMLAQFAAEDSGAQAAVASAGAPPQPSPAG